MKKLTSLQSAFLSVLAIYSLRTLLGAPPVLVMYCNCNNVIKHDSKTCLLYICRLLTLVLCFFCNSHDLTQTSTPSQRINSFKYDAFSFTVPGGSPCGGRHMGRVRLPPGELQCLKHSKTHLHKFNLADEHHLHKSSHWGSA